MTVAILVPVLARPQNVAPLLDSIAAATPAPYRVVFIADPDDLQQQRAIPRQDGIDLMLLAGNYAQKIAAGVRATTEPLVFFGADDLHFHPRWLEAARAKITEGSQVVGVNDLIERRPDRVGHATHFLVTRGYAELPCLDRTPGPLFTGYTHNFVDDECIATAKHRGVYAYAESAHVEHRHPMNGTAVDDDTYRKGRRAFRQDRRRFVRRQQLWT